MKLRVAEQNHLPFVDGLRGIAILAVLCAHGSMAAPGHSFSKPLTMLFASGTLGVQLFFLLSAFTLYASSQTRFRQDRRPVSSFYIRRSFRILPLWWLMIAAYAVLGRWCAFPWHEVAEPGGGVTTGNVVAHATFTFGFFRDFVKTLVPGGWSLFVEETFYIFLPLVFARVRSLAGAIQLGVVTAAIYAVWYAVRPEGFATDMAPLAQWQNFAAGVIVYFLRESWSASEWPKETVRVLDLCVALGLPCLIYVEAHHGAFAVTAAWAMLFILAAQPSSLWNRVCSFAPLRHLGVCCYSIYLMHPLVLFFLTPLETRFAAALGIEHAAKEVRFIAWFPIFVAASYATGFLGFVFIERPCIGLGKRIIRWHNDGPALDPAPDAAR